MNRGTVVFDDGAVIAEIVDVALRDNRFVIEAVIAWPHPRFNANAWRVHGADGSTIYTVLAANRPPMLVDAHDVANGTTTVYCPASLVDGADILPLAPRPVPDEGTITYR